MLALFCLIVCSIQTSDNVSEAIITVVEACPIDEMRCMTGSYVTGSGRRRGRHASMVIFQVANMGCVSIVPGLHAMMDMQHQGADGM